MAEKILGSQLTDWQKLDMMRRFIQPKLEYILKTMLPNHSWLKGLEDTERRMAKKAFRLPWKTITSFFYVPWRIYQVSLKGVQVSHQQGSESGIDVCQMVEEHRGSKNWSEECQL